MKMIACLLLFLLVGSNPNAIQFSGNSVCVDGKCLKTKVNVAIVDSTIYVTMNGYVGRNDYEKYFYHDYKHHYSFKYATGFMIISPGVKEIRLVADHQSVLIPYEFTNFK